MKKLNTISILVLMILFLDRQGNMKAQTTYAQCTLTINKDGMNEWDISYSDINEPDSMVFVVNSACKLRYLRNQETGSNYYVNSAPQNGNRFFTGYWIENMRYSKVKKGNKVILSYFQPKSEACGNVEDIPESTKELLSTLPAVSYRSGSETRMCSVDYSITVVIESKDQEDVSTSTGSRTYDPKYRRRLIYSLN